MINYFEGSQENLLNEKSYSRGDLPSIKPALHAAPLSPLRLARSRRTSKHKSGGLIQLVLCAP